MRQISCDRCGGNAGVDTGYGVTQAGHGLSLDLPHGRTLGHRDLCGDCMRGLQEWLDAADDLECTIVAHIDEPQAYDQFLDEPTEAYEAFALFATMGPDRTLLGAYRRLPGHNRAKSVPPEWEAWSIENDWHGRALCLDAMDRAAAEVRKRHPR